MIILDISGSMAAYKSIEIAKLLIQNGFDVVSLLTQTAEDFVSVLILLRLFPGKFYLHNDLLSKHDEMVHISLSTIS